MSDKNSTEQPDNFCQTTAWHDFFDIRLSGTGRKHNTIRGPTAQMRFEAVGLKFLLGKELKKMKNDLLYKFGLNPSTTWIDSYLRCTACGNHLICNAHAEALKKEFREAKKALVEKDKCRNGFC